MLELNGISKVYGQGASQVEALRDVDLNISPGEFVAVMGTSGCGKTTLLNIIGCLDTATSGIYTLQGKDVSRLSLKDKARVRNKTFGFVFQAFNLLAEYTVLENVTLPLRYSGVPKRRWKEQGLGVLERLGIADLSSRYPDQLSGGQQQRVAIARALVNDPVIIIADEPTGKLDTGTGREIVSVLCDLVEKQKKIVILATHDGAVASRAQRLLQMVDGRIIDDSTVPTGAVSFSHPAE